MSESPFWNENWANLQQSYWENLNEMSRKAMGVQPTKAPWESAMDSWWSALSPSATPDVQAFMEKMLNQGKTFFQMGDVFNKNMQSTTDWSEALNKTFEQMQGSFDNSMGQANASAEQSFEQFSSFWQSPMEGWQKFASSSNGLPFNADVPGAGNLFERLIAMPGFGINREDEDRNKRLLQAGVDYQKATMAYNQFFADFSQVSLERMKQKIAGIAESGKSIDSARDLYNVWVAASEEVYAERAITPEYAQLHGGMVNTLMKVKKIWAEIMDQRLSAMNIPTQRETRTLQCRLQASRREIRSLQREMDLLKEQVLAIKTIATKDASAVEESKPAPVKKKVAKKKVSKKKAVAKK